MRKLAWIGFYIAIAYTLFAAVQFKANQHVTEVVVNIYTDNKERALIGKEEGDSVEVNTPGGQKSYEILSIAYK